jgi:ATP-dependent RNA helicase DHX57
VDCGKVKETSYDPENGMSRLSEIWITRAAGRQRRGRAGRTQPGTCYKLYTRRQEDRFPAFPIPEIKRVPLESVALTVKVAKEGEDVKVRSPWLDFHSILRLNFIQAFLSRAVDPPEVIAMDKALAVLEELGAIDSAGSLTALGRHMVRPPRGTERLTYSFRRLPCPLT